MSVGYPITKVDLDNRMGGMIVNVRAALGECVNFKAGFLDDATLGTDAVLSALGYTAGEITTIRNAFIAMKLVSDIARGQIAQGVSPADFYFDAKKLIGLNV